MEFINRIEASLLNDLLELYQDDLKTEEHTDIHKFCLACCKGRIIAAILHYQFANTARKLSKHRLDVGESPSDFRTD